MNCSIFSFDRHALDLLDRMLTLDPSQVTHIFSLTFFCNIEKHTLHSPLLTVPPPPPPPPKILNQ